MHGAGLVANIAMHNDQCGGTCMAIVWALAVPCSMGKLFSGDKVWECDLPSGGRAGAGFSRALASMVGFMPARGPWGIPRPRGIPPCPSRSGRVLLRTPPWEFPSSGL